MGRTNKSGSLWFLCFTQRQRARTTWCDNISSKSIRSDTYAHCSDIEKKDHLHFSLMWILLPPLKNISNRKKSHDFNSNEPLTAVWTADADFGMIYHSQPSLVVFTPHDTCVDATARLLTTSSTRSSTMRPCSSVRTLLTHIQPSSSSLWTINMSPFRKLEIQRIPINITAHKELLQLQIPC